jgi:hypothetical protein
MKITKDDAFTKKITSDASKGEVPFVESRCIYCQGVLAEIVSNVLMCSLLFSESPVWLPSQLIDSSSTASLFCSCVCHVL